MKAIFQIHEQKTSIFSLLLRIHGERRGEWYKMRLQNYSLGNLFHAAYLRMKIKLMLLHTVNNMKNNIFGGSLESP